MRTFGNPTFLKEETRAAWGWNRLEQMSQDLGYTVRTLRKSPGFTLVARPNSLFLSIYSWMIRS